jgi:peroxiredoxin
MIREGAMNAKNLRNFLVWPGLVASLLLFLGTAVPAAPQAQPVSQEPVMRPAMLGQPFPPLSLSSYEGAQVDLKNYRGKNVVLIVPRVYAGEGRWCTICSYQYAEAAAETASFRAEFNAEIVFLFPFGRDVVSEFLAVTPSQLEKIKGWKNPPEPDKLDEQGRQRLARMRALFPRDMSMKEAAAPAPFPILLDPDRQTSKTLGVFSSEWGGSKGDQGIPAVFILDGSGILRFKYISQNTADRPDFAYLAWILKSLR